MRHSRRAPGPADGKVGFLIAGTQKAGTSALANYLGRHPEICMATCKEVHFFDNEEYFQKEKIDYSDYHAFFEPGPSHRIMGEATPIYMYWYDAPRRIWAYNPAMKFIIVLRNPIERAYSHWNMEHRRNAERLSFADALMRERVRCREALPFQHRVYSYVDRGFYSEQLRRIWTYFPKSQTHVIRHEDLKNDPERILRDICLFLEVSPMAGVSKELVHCTPYSGPMSVMERRYLLFEFEYEIRNLERLLGWDCSSWIGFDRLLALA